MPRHATSFKRIAGFLQTVGGALLVLSLGCQTVLFWSAPDHDSYGQYSTLLTPPNNGQFLSMTKAHMRATTTLTSTKPVSSPNDPPIEEQRGNILDYTSTVKDPSDPSSPYAYTWLLGAIHEDRPAYKGFLYDILVSANLLRKLGSKADFWLFAQLDHASSRDTLPDEDMRLLKAVGIQVKLLDKPTKSSFAQLVYEKFRPLQMTQYRRVMFLDADILPLVNLDYLFHLSDPEHDDPETPTILRPSFMMATRGEPCNTGLFVMHPQPGAWEEMLGVIQRQREASLTLPYPHFDFKDGWGHNFQNEGDWWEAIDKNGTAWRYHAAHSDQGLWYYYTKYFKKDVSILIGNRLQNWSPRGEGEKPMREEFIGLLSRYAPKPIADQYRCSLGPKGWDDSKSHLCNPVYREFAHFMGSTKPWQVSFCNICKRNEKLIGAHWVWLEELRELNDKLKMGLDMDKWDEKHLPELKESPLGYIAKFADNEQVTFNATSDVTAVDGNTIHEDPMLSSLTNSSDPSLTVAYAVSFIKCGDFQTHSAGLTDASLVLRHSIHKISRRNPESGSKYDYKMYAIVHRQAEACSQVLRETGFEVMIVDPPVLQEEIQGEYLRRNIHREWCCGSDEFIKLYAYTLPEDIVVHVDIDFAFYKPMDDLFDAIRFDKDSAEGKVAREKLLLERPTDALPDRIDAFLTRDWPQVAPGKFPAAYQAGFLVARRDPGIVEEMTAVIREGNYTEGWGWNSGWGGLGYGGYVGAMAMQGFIAYFYDHVRPSTAVELNQCRFNHMGMDVRYRHHPNFRPNIPGVGGCRNGAAECEDCMTTKMENIYSVHYTMCRKPWQCMATPAHGGKAPGRGRGTAINIDQVNLDHCMELVGRWHELRSDFENLLFDLTNDESIKSAVNGTYKPEVFRGHCDGDGNEHYRLINAKPESFRRVHELYQ